MTNFEQALTSTFGKSPEYRAGANVFDERASCIEWTSSTLFLHVYYRDVTITPVVLLFL